MTGSIAQAGRRALRDGWWAAAERRPSPNCDLRPPGCGVELVVIHGISLPPGEYGGPWIDALFRNTLDCNAHPWFARLEGLRVSSHLLIRRDGRAVQYVPFQLRAWHAGASAYQGRRACNDFSVGVELEGRDAEPYASVQYETLYRLLRDLLRAFPDITPARVVGHADVAPGRKTDPGQAFDWAGVRRCLEIEYRKLRGMRSFRGSNPGART